MKSFYDIAKELEESMNKFNEAEVDEDNIFDLKCTITFDNIAGGLAFSINDGNVSFSTSMVEGKQGNYRLETAIDDYKNLYNNLKDEFKTLANLVDDGVKQILAKYGLKET